MSRSDACAPQLLLEAEVEVRRVNTDEYIGRRIRPTPHQFAAQSQQARDMFQRLDQAHDGKRFGRFPLLAACFEHRRAGDAFELGIGNRSAKRTNQPGTERVARCLTCNKSEFHAGSLARNRR